MLRIAVVLLTFMIGCTAPTTSTLLGDWGGQTASMVLTTSGGTVSYQCGSGTIDQGWTVSEDGGFAGSGVHYFGGGPVPPGGSVPHPARYSGHLDGDRFALNVGLTDLNQTLGPYQLIRGGPLVHEVCE